MEYVLAILVSLVTEGIKKFTKADSFEVHLILFTVAVAGSAAYVYLVDSAFWPLIVQTLVVAAGFHNLVLRKFSAQ
jgi:hypothetical protein